MGLRVPLLSFMLGACAVGSGNSAAPGDSRSQSAALFLFEDHSPLSGCDPIPDPKGNQPAVYMALGTQFALHRKDQLSIGRKEVQALTVRPRSAMVSISGTQADAYSVELCASAGKLAGADAQDLLDAIHLSRTGDTVSV